MARERTKAALKQVKADGTYQSEAELQRICQDMLTRAGLLHWRNPVQGSLYTLNGRTFMRPSPIQGFPDISFLSPLGVLYCAEFKSTKGKPSPKQIEWINALNESGARAKIIRTKEEMITFIVECLGGNVNIM